MGQCLSYIFGKGNDPVKPKSQQSTSNGKKNAYKPNINNANRDSNSNCLQPLNTDLEDQEPTGMDSKVSPKSIYVTNERFFKDVIDQADFDKEINQKRKINLDSFTIVKVLGRGSFGKVMLVQKKDNQKYYAIKVLKKDQIEKRNQKIHTKAEREILENMNSPFIVQLHYAFQNEEKLYLVMDFMRGGELFFHLRKAKRFAEDVAMFYAAEILLALEYLHQRGTIYRDLKPENVLLSQSGHIKITDFGLSKQGLQYGDKTNTFCGTPEYLAPEILRAEGHDKSADWWSFGALLYEMLSGAPPFYSKDRHKMFQNILEKPIEMKAYFSQEATLLLKSLLVLDPTKRLGAGIEDAKEIKKHPFFKKIDWEELAMLMVEPPTKPDTNDFLKNFDPMFIQEPLTETPLPFNKPQKPGVYDNYSNFTYEKNRVLNASSNSGKIEESSELQNDKKEPLLSKK